MPNLYNDIDWNLLWQNARKQKAWTSKTAADWDKKAPSFAKRNIDSPYADLFLSRLPLEKNFSVLDVGSGPGTLAFPLASRVQSVTALDYSPKMITILQDLMDRERCINVLPVLGSWEDDWEKLGLGTYDITIASRSMGVANLEEAIIKLNDHSRKFVFITDRISPTPFDPQAFKAIGRSFNSGPDYIYTINTLYTMGIYANIDVLQLAQDVTFSSMEEAFQSYNWMFNDLSSLEEKALLSYIKSITIGSSAKHLTLRKPHPPKWAMIWWEKGKIV